MKGGVFLGFGVSGCAPFEMGRFSVKLVAKLLMIVAVLLNMAVGWVL